VEVIYWSIGVGDVGELPKTYYFVGGGTRYADRRPVPEGLSRNLRYRIDLEVYWENLSKSEKDARKGELIR
jgi:hypothetical protein